MGDGRTHDQACALRTVPSTDGTTADYYPFDHAFLGRVANRIINECRGINRVTYGITSKLPGRLSGGEAAKIVALGERRKRRLEDGKRVHPAKSYVSSAFRQA